MAERLEISNLTRRCNEDLILGVLVAILVCVIRGREGERFKLPLLGEAADRL